MTEKDKAKLFNEEGRSEYAIMSQVAHMYYNLNMLQPEIAKKLYFSRSKVSRILKRARELGIVEINVRAVPGRSLPLEKRVEAIYDLKDSVVIENFKGYERSESQDLDAVTNYAALYMSELFRDQTIVGLTRGRTVDKVVAQLRKIHDCDLEVVQLMGSSTNTYMSSESRELVNRVISTFSASAHFLNAPLYVDDVYAKEILLKDANLQSVFQMMKRCKIILTGLGDLGNIPEGKEGWYGYMTKEHIEELINKGAVGSICAQYYDINGKLINCEWNKKCIAMPFEDIIKNKTTVVVASGENKVAAIKGALRGGLINVLITDAETCREVLA